MISSFSFLLFSYYDYIHGVDVTVPKNDSSSNEDEIDNIDDRTLLEGLLRPDDVVRLGLVLYGIGTILFLCLTHLSPAKEPYLAMIFFGALPLSFLYTGGIGEWDMKNVTIRDFQHQFRFRTIYVILFYDRWCYGSV